MKRYQVYTNDVGPNGYSQYTDVRAKSDSDAIRKARNMAPPFFPVRILAIPSDAVKDAFVAGSGTSPKGLCPRKGVFSKWGTEIS